MSELGNPHIESGGTQEQESLESLIPGVGLESFREQIQDIKNNPELYKKFLAIIKENLPIEGGLKFRRIINNIEKEGIGKEKEGIGKEKEGIGKEKEGIGKEKEGIGKEKNKEGDIILERYKSSQIAAKENTQAIENINASLTPELKGRLDGEVERQLSDIQSGNISTQASEFLNSIGASASIDIQKPENQAILRARISTQVYLNEAQQNGEFNTQFKEYIQVLKRNAPTLGVAQSANASGVNNLLSDITNKTRESVVDTVGNINRESPDNRVTRTGDRLTFSDPKNDKYSYEIDLSKQPPRLAKTRNGLSISRDVSVLSEAEHQEKQERENNQKDLKKSYDTYGASTQEFWGARRAEYALMGTKSVQGADGKMVETQENIYSSVFLGENRNLQNRYEVLEQQLATGNISRDEKVNVIKSMLSLTQDMKSDNLANMMDKNETVYHPKINTMLEERIRKLEAVEGATEKLSAAEKKVGTEPKETVSKYEGFDKEASASLDFLIDNGLDRLGQARFTEFMEAWNRQNRDKVGYQIHLDANPAIDDIQKKELRDFIQKKYGNAGGQRNEALAQEKKNLEQATFISRNWSTLENRRAYLFDEKSPNEARNAIPESPQSNTTLA